MVDNITDIAEAQAGAQGLLDIFGQLQDKIGQIISVLGGLPGKIKEGKDSLDGLNSSAQNVKDSLDKAFKVEGIENILALDKNVRLFFDGVVTGSRESIAAMEKFSTGPQVAFSAILTSLTSLPTAFNAIGDSAVISGKTIDDSFAGLINNPVLTRFLDSAQAAKTLENNILSLTGKYGSLNMVLGASGGDLKNLDNYLNSFNNQIKETALHSGLGEEQIIKFAASLFQIPGAFDKIKVNTPTGSLDLMTAAVEATRGTTNDLSDVLNLMTDRFNKFNEVGQKPLELMTRMFGTAQTLGIHFNTVRDVVNSTAERFKFLGDNSEGAIRILDGFAPTLQRAGVGQEGIKEIVNSLTGAVGQLGLAQKAFLSAQTGGPGGLQGGYQIDLLLKEGKIDEVFSKMQETLIKNFGRITTLEEAAKSPEAAEQLTKQTAFLRQGPFGQIAQTDAQAYRILDAFQKGARPTLEGKAEEEQTGQFREAMTRGNALEERQLDEATKASIYLQDIRANTAVMNEALLRRTFGTEGPVGKSLLAERTAAQQQLGQGKEEREFGFLAGERPKIPGISATPEQNIANTIITAEEAIGKVSDATGFKLTRFQDKIVSVADAIGLIERDKLKTPENRTLAETRNQRAALIGEGARGTHPTNLPAESVVLFKVQIDPNGEQRIISKVTGNIKKIENSTILTGFHTGQH